MKQLDNLIDMLNHRMTKLENDVKWLKRIGYYMATILTATMIGGFL